MLRTPPFARLAPLLQSSHVKKMTRAEAGALGGRAPKKKAAQLPP